MGAGGGDHDEAAMSASGLIARLDRELRELWTAPADGPPLSRVCTMNIEVVAPSRELLERYTPVIDEVTASIPARAILASVEPELGGDELTGSANAVCSLDTGRRICSERITLACRGNAANRAASAIEAFLVPEIPTALVWLGRVHADDPVFGDLASDAHRIILDSEYTSLASVIHVASWARKQPNAPRVADLAWTRLATWQELLARFFDEPDDLALAHTVSRVRLEQAGDRGARIGAEGALLLGWLGTRLGWKTSRLAGALRWRRPDGGNVVVELGVLPRPAGVAPHSLAGLTIEAGDGAIVGSIRRDLGSGRAEPGSTPDADVVLWQLDKRGCPATEQRVRLQANKAAMWLERTLHRPAYDPGFEESVAFAEHIVEDGLIAT
jgi:glucose-6-phosphate dehydrogenase assembly protein OpcA